MPPYKLKSVAAKSPISNGRRRKELLLALLHGIKNLHGVKIEQGDHL